MPNTCIELTLMDIYWQFGSNIHSWRRAIDPGLLGDLHFAIEMERCLCSNPNSLLYITNEVLKGNDHMVYDNGNPAR